MLVQPQIADGKAIFPGVNQGGFWKVGQVLTIGKIVTHKGECVDSLMLEPQGIAHLISKEVIELPPDVCALAHVLTRKCNDGLLTLGIGVIDPGWENRISSPILNFSSECRLLQVDDEFIRVTFHRIKTEDGAVSDSPKSNIPSKGYLRDVRYRAVANFGKNFLNIKQLVGEASKEENQRIREALLKYVPIGAFSLALFALLVTTGVAVVTSMLKNDSPAVVQADATDQRVLNLEDRIRELEKRLPLDSQPVRQPANSVPPSQESQRK